MIAENAERPKVLVIDDECGPRESLRILLKPDYDVKCAEDVDRGVECLTREQPDLVIMDIRMPGKSGIEGLQEIRALDDRVSVVMLTGYGALETAQQAIRAGATDYLNKPFDTGEMLATVSRYVQRTRLERKRACLQGQAEEINRRLVGELADREQLASLGQNAAELVHDLRNPLMIVKGYVDLLLKQLARTREQMGGEYDNAAEYLDIIEQNVRRCCELSHLWRNLGRAGPAEDIALSDLCADLKASVNPLAAARGVRLVWQDDAGTGVVLRGRHAQLLRALSNLIDNAIDAAPQGAGRVACRCALDGSCVEISVADNGEGIPPDLLERVFEPYFTTKKDKGMGLGMAISRRVIEEAGGRIELHSAPGRGTEVRVRLPVGGDARCADA